MHGTGQGYLGIQVVVAKSSGSVSDPLKKAFFDQWTNV